MNLTTEIPIIHTSKSTISDVDFNNLEFGKHMSDHMFVARYANGEWCDPKIVPFADISIAPTALALHYGQSVFEGMKAFKMMNGDISIFRIDKHYERLLKSLSRMSMPSLPFSLFEDGLKSLVNIDHEWVPEGEGKSLYIRPLIFASEGRFGVKISEEYLFIIMAGPVGSFYPKPLNVKVEDTYTRAAQGGTGAAKCAGNYGGSFYPTQLARQKGFDQVLWTDGSAQLNIEESGTMNVFFVIDNVIVTPPLSDSILGGITRDSLLHLASAMSFKVEERKISAFELITAHEKGILTEVFGAGTAAITAPIATITIKDKKIELPGYSNSSICKQLEKRLTDIRLGKSEDVFKWNTILLK